MGTFPDRLDPITVPLPIMIPGSEGAPDITELTFTVTKVLEREYGDGVYIMASARYEMVTDLETQEFGFVTNRNTGKIQEASEAIFFSAAKYAAFVLAYTKQTPPLPLPDNPGLFSPWSSAVIDTVDGTSPFRGFCAGIHSLASDAVETAEILFRSMWHEEPHGD